MGHNILNEIRLLRKENYNTEIYFKKADFRESVFEHENSGKFY